MIRITDPTQLAALASPLSPAIAHGIVVCGYRRGKTKRLVFWYHTGKQVEALVHEDTSDMATIALETGVESTQLQAMIDSIDLLLPMLKSQGNHYFLDHLDQPLEVRQMLVDLVYPNIYTDVIGPYLGDVDRHPEYIIDLFTHGRNNLMIEVGKILAPKQIELEQKAKEVYTYLKSIGQDEKAERLLHSLTRLKQ